METLEKTLYHDGIPFMRYALEYPSGEEFSFAEAMTRTYAAYLEEDYFIKLCALYDADPERRKRFRHRIVQIVQNCKLYQEERIVSLYFHVLENEHSYAFSFTWDRERGIMMKPRDFGVKRRCFGMRKSLRYDGKFLYIFSKKGDLVEKILIDDRNCKR